MSKKDATVEKKEKKPIVVDKEEVNKKAKQVDEEVKEEQEDHEDNKSKRKREKEKKREEFQLGDPVTENKLIHSLTEDSMTIKVSVSAWRGTASDKSLAKELAGDMQGNVDGFSVSLKYCPPEIRQELARRMSVLTKLVNNNSLPWADGTRLFPSRLYPQLRQALKQAEVEATDYVKRMAGKEMHKEIDDYARRVLGKAYNSERVPSPEKILSSFKIEVTPGTVSVPSKKLSGMDNAQMEELTKEIRKGLASRYNTAVMELIDSLSETLQELVKELGSAPKRDKYATLRDMIKRRMLTIVRLDVFKSPRIMGALRQIEEDVLIPLENELANLKSDKTGEKRKQLKKGVEKAVDLVEDLTIG